MQKYQSAQPHNGRNAIRIGDVDTRLVAQIVLPATPRKSQTGDLLWHPPRQVQTGRESTSSATTRRSESAPMWGLSAMPTRIVVRSDADSCRQQVRASLRP